MTLTYLQTNKLQYLALLLFGLFAPMLSTAQESVSLSVSPAIFDMNASPSQVWESKLRIVNNNPFELTIYAEPVNFAPAGEDGTAAFLPLTTDSEDTSTLGDWISVPDSALIIPAEQTLEIPVRITLPDDASPGGHYAAVLIGTRPPEDSTDSTRVETSQVVSSLIFLRVTGDVIEEGNIRGFRAIDGIVEKPEVDFELRFENSGNVHLRPEGEIRIFNMWGQERGLIPVNQKTLFGNILGDSIRSYRFSWQGEWSPVDIGRYKAEATLVYGQDGRKTTYSEASFWIIPWRALLGIMLTIAVFVLLITWLVRLYVRKMLAIAGLNEQNPLQKKLVNEKRREVSVVAPIEAGILDLRSRFSAGKKTKLSNLFEYIYEYKTFFTGLIIVIVILYIVSWFFVSVSDDNRAFEVTVSGSGQEVRVDSESLQYEQSQQYEVVAKRDIPPLQLINRSGVNGTAAEIALALEEFGYTISSVSTDLDSAEEQTVIVYDPSIADEALELSTILDNALLSAFELDESEDVQITVYIGSDLSN